MEKIQSVDNAERRSKLLYTFPIRIRDLNIFTITGSLKFFSFSTLKAKCNTLDNQGEPAVLSYYVTYGFFCHEQRGNSTKHGSLQLCSINRSTEQETIPGSWWVQFLLCLLLSAENGYVQYTHIIKYSLEHPVMCLLHMRICKVFVPVICKSGQLLTSPKAVFHKHPAFLYTVISSSHCRVIATDGGKKTPKFHSTQSVVNWNQWGWMGWLKFDRITDDQQWQQTRNRAPFWSRQSRSVV